MATKKTKPTAKSGAGSKSAPSKGAGASGSKRATSKGGIDPQRGS